MFQDVGCHENKRWIEMEIKANPVTALQRHGRNLTAGHSIDIIIISIMINMSPLLIAPSDDHHAI